MLLRKYIYLCIVFAKLIVGYAVPVELAGRTLVYGQNFQFQYLLPQNATFFTEFFKNSSRRRRESVNWDERITVYRLLEEGLQRWELVPYFEHSCKRIWYSRWQHENLLRYIRVDARILKDYKLNLKRCTKIQRDNSHVYNWIFFCNL